MIKLARNIKPEVLEINEAIWSSNLHTAIQKYGCYSNIPNQEKMQLTQYYRHEKIKEALFSSSYEKCAFCECKPSEGGNIEVEHFKPKSIYPDSTFEWDNFLPSCRKCNGLKSDHDTVKEPIINPYDVDPSTVFKYNDIRIVAKDGLNKVTAKRTIEICNLNSVRLMKPRSEILVNLYYFIDSLTEALTDYDEADTDIKKRNRLRSINESIEQIELLMQPQEKYSAFCTNFLENNVTFNKAKRLINTTIAA